MTFLGCFSETVLRGGGTPPGGGPGPLRGSFWGVFDGFGVVFGNLRQHQQRF